MGKGRAHCLARTSDVRDAGLGREVRGQGGHAQGGGHDARPGWQFGRQQHVLPALHTLAESEIQLLEVALAGEELLFLRAVDALGGQQPVPVPARFDGDGEQARGQPFVTGHVLGAQTHGGEGDGLLTARGQAGQGGTQLLGGRGEWLLVGIRHEFGPRLREPS